MEGEKESYHDSEEKPSTGVGIRDSSDDFKGL